MSSAPQAVVLIHQMMRNKIGSIPVKRKNMIGYYYIGRNKKGAVLVSFDFSWSPFQWNKSEKNDMAARYEEKFFFRFLCFLTSDPKEGKSFSYNLFDSDCEAVLPCLDYNLGAG
jgi:hypothetical protein